MCLQGRIYSFEGPLSVAKNLDYDFFFLFIRITKNTN